MASLVFSGQTGGLGKPAPIKTALKCNYSAWRMAKLSNLPGFKQGDCKSEATWNSVPALCGKNSGMAKTTLCEVITGTSREQQQQASLIITPFLYPLVTLSLIYLRWYKHTSPQGGVHTMDLSSKSEFVFCSSLSFVGKPIHIHQIWPLMHHPHKTEC